MQNKSNKFIVDNAQLLLMLAIFTMAFCLRLHFLVTYHYPLMRHEQDSIGYMEIARNMLQFKPWQSAYFPPFYPFVIAIFSFLPVKLETAARVASITMDSLIIVPLFLLLSRLLNGFAAFGVCALWTCVSLSFTLSPMPFSTYLLCMLSGIYFLYCVLYEERPLSWFFYAGASLALGYLTRPEGIAGFACGIIFCIFFVYRERSANRSMKKGFLLYSFGFLILAVPYWIYLHSALGYWTFTGKTAIAISGIDGSSTLKAGALVGKTANGLAMWLDKFGGISGGIIYALTNAKDFLLIIHKTHPTWMVFVALIGFCLLWFDRKYKNRLILLIPILITFPVYIANLPKTTGYIYPLYPIFFTAFVWCIDRIFNFITVLFGNRCIGNPLLNCKNIFSALMVAIIIYIGVLSFKTATAFLVSPRTILEVELTKKILVEPGEFIKSVSNSSDPVMTRWGVITYYAERPLIVLPKGNVMEVIEYGRKAGAKFLVIDTESVETRRQELIELLNPLYYGEDINPKYRILPIKVGGMEDVGGYVIYSYLP